MNALFRHRSATATPSSRPAAEDRAELDALREMVPPPAHPGSHPTATRGSKRV